MAARDSVDLNGAETFAAEGFYSGILPQAQAASPGNAVRVAQATASAPPATVVIELEDGNIARLPAGADISNVSANGADLQFVQPDGTVIVVPGGAIANLVLFIGDIQIPAEAVAQIFATNDIQTAAGPEGGEPDGTGSYEDLGGQNVGEGETAIDLLLNTELPEDTANSDEQVITNFAAQVLGGTDALIADDGLSEGNRPDGESDSKFAEGTILINEAGATFAFDVPTTKFTSGGNDIEWTLDDTNRVIGTIPGQEGPFIAVEATIDPASGAWRVEIFAPLDHVGPGQGELLTLLFPVRITDAGGIPTLTALSVGVEDDTPIARNDPSKEGDFEATEGDSSPLNLILTFDVSGSMGDHEGSHYFDDRLDLSIQAAIALLNASDPQSVLVVTFANSANASAWMTKAQALVYLANNIPTTNGGTDYEDALEAIQAAYEADPPSGETKSYFFTDGDPSDGGIGNNDQEEWDDFLDQNKIESFAVGAGDGISQNDNDLKDIASAPDSDHVIILDGDDLEPFKDLIETAPPQQVSASGNVLANDSFGADGGEGVFSITVNGITYLRSVYEMDVVEVKETSTGGTLIFNFSNGNWEYFAPDEMGQSGVATFSYTIMDNDGDPATASVSITVTAVNDAPDLILGLASGSYRDAFENTQYNNSDGSTDWSGNAWSENSDGGSGANGGTIRISGDELRFGADDDSASITRTLDLSGATSATLTFNFKDVNTEANNNERLTVEFSANGTTWVILDVLDANDQDGLKTFNLTGPFDSDAKIRFSVTDMSENSEYLAIDNVNVAYTGVASPIYVENGPAVQILAGASVIDPDGPANFNGGSLQVLLSNSSSGDQLLFTGANVSVSGTDVVTTPHGIVGTVTGLGTTSLLITFNANATPAAISMLLDAIAFSSTSENPSNGIRTAHVTFNDGGNTGTGGPLSDTETVQIGVTPFNDAPVATVPAGPFLATEQQNFNLHGQGLFVSDVDAGNDRISVTLSVTHGVITVVRGNSGIDNGDVSGSGTSSVTIQGSTAEINNLLGGLGTGTVVFNANSDNPPPGATLTLLVNDTGDNGSGGPQTDSKSVAINITPVNDAPVISSNGGGATASLSVSENQTALTTVTSTDPDIGATKAFSISGGADAAKFSIHPTTGVLTFLSAPNFESPTDVGGNNVYDVQVQVSDGALSDTQSIAVTITNVAPATPTDSNNATNSIAEGAVNGTVVGITAASSDPAGGTITYSLSNSAGGRFAINSSTGVVTVANGSLLNYENATSHTITVQASDGTLSTTQTFTIGVNNVAPTTPTDTNGGTNTVAEGAANGTAVGITASSTDLNGPAVTYSLTDNAGGRFAINSSTGVVTVANGSLLNFEGATSHNITVRASDGNMTSTQSFTIAVSNAAPSTPTDTNGSSNSVAEGAANGSTVGVTASSTDVNGPNVVYSLTNDAGGRFAVNSSTGVVTVANGSLLNYESATSHGITVQASDGVLTSTQNFTINVSNVAPTVPTDTNGAANAIAEGAANGTVVGVTAASTDINGATVTYSLTNNAGGRFAINSSTGVVTVANGALLDFETATSHGITVQASDGNLTNTQSFTINVTDVNEVATAAATINAPSSLNYWSSITTGDMTPINRLSFQDKDSPGVVRVTLQMDDAGDDFDATSSGGVTVTLGGSDGTDSQEVVTLEGTLVAINAYIAAGNILWNPDDANNGEAGVLTVTVDDNGSTEGGNITVANINIGEITPNFSNSSSNNFAGVNFNQIDTQPFGDNGSDTMVTSWSHRPLGTETVYNGGNSNDEITLVFTADQLQSILTDSTNRSALDNLLDGDSSNLDLGDTSWNAEVVGFEDAKLGLAAGPSGYVVYTPADSSVGIPNHSGDTDLTGDNNDTTADLVTGTSGNDAGIHGGIDFTDTANNGNDILLGLGGNDILWGGAGADLLLGGEGNDDLHGGNGNDVLSGGSGADDFFFSARGATVEDFITDYSFVEGDRIDLSSLLTSITLGNLADHVRITQSGNDLLIQAKDSAGGAFDASHDVVTLAGYGTAAEDPVKIFIDGVDYTITE